MPFVLQPKRWPAANRIWATSIAVCVPVSEHPQAITATAHKLARIIYHLLTTGQAYDESVFIGQVMLLILHGA
jgi:hypothetical protein